jgi:regulator of sigma E protease
MISIIIAVLTLGILVAVHEGGHFVAAKLSGVKVEKFSVGFGPRLLGFHWQETEFVISLIPLGGYVKMLDENPGEKKQLSEEEKQYSFTHKAWYQRAFIAFSGPFINFIFAIIILIFSFLVGKTYSDQLPIVGRVAADYQAYFQPGDQILQVNSIEVSGWNQILQELSEDEPNSFLISRQGDVKNLTLENVGTYEFSNDILPEVAAIIGEASVGLPAYQAGLQEGDLILEINQQPVEDWYEMQQIISSSEKDRLDFKIQRDQEVFSKQIKPQVNMIDERKIIGITQARNIEIEENYSLAESIKLGTLSAVSFVALNYAMLGKLVLNPQELKNSVGGPVMLYSMSKQTAKRGLSDILAFIAALNLILMVMNLLPIPILDGGQILFCFIEGIRQKALTEKTQIILQNIGFVLLMSLMIFAFWNDISKMFERNSSVKKQETEQMIERLLEENKEKDQ